MSATTLALLDLVPLFLRAVTSAPAHSSFLTPTLDAILNAAAAFIEQGEAGAAALQALTQQIEAMVAANRDPSPDEWAALKARSEAAHAVIQGGQNAKSPGAVG